MANACPALVIGYGNSLRRDDAVGPLAADAVRTWRLPDVITLSVTQLTPELAEPLSAVLLAIFVDARVREENEMATVTVLPLEPSDGPPLVDHLGDPGQLLALSRLVYGHSPRSWLVTIPVSDLGVGEGLSPLARAGLHDALEQIRTLLNK